MERTLKKSKLDAWKDYAERHYQNWVNYAEEFFAAKVKPEELIFVRGWVKTPKWVVATLHRRGVYELYVDMAEELSATLTFGGKDISEDTQLGEVRFGADVSGVRADMVREIIRTNGRPLPDCFRDGDPCTRCLFVKGLKVENSFWTPRRVVAAAEPQDPGSDDPGYDRTKVHAADHTEMVSSHANRSCGGQVCAILLVFSMIESDILSLDRILSGGYHHLITFRYSPVRIGSYVRHLFCKFLHEHCPVPPLYSSQIVPPR